MPVRRLMLAGALLIGGVPARAQGVIDVGPPLGEVILRVPPARDTTFVQDLVDYTNRYGFFVIGRPGGPRIGARDTFAAWYRRDDGITMLVTDISGPERMEAFFYGRKDGTGGAAAQDLMGAYERRMGGYPAFPAR